MPRRLGQHFLKDDRAHARIADALDISAGDTIIEIGPGHGELTRHLLARAEAAGAQCIAIERDARLLPGLRAQFPALRIDEGDAPTLLSRYASLPQWKLVGNIPYYITGRLLRVVSELAHKPSKTVLLLQEEVARRIVAAPPHMNRLAALTQFWAAPQILFGIGPESFSPPPKVHSAVIALTTVSQPPCEPSRYFATVKKLFAQPRKTIGNNLGDEKNDVALHELLHMHGIAIGDRPQNLSIAALVAIASR